MERYYRVRSPLSNQTYQLALGLDWDSAVAYYGDRLIGEVDQSGMLKRFHVPSTVKANIDKLLLTMNADNVEEVTHQVNKLHQAALPDHQVLLNSLTRLHQDYYNNVIIPTLYPEENCKVCESPMLREIFPELFKDVPLEVPRVMPEIVKVVNDKQVVDTDVLDERSRRMQIPRHERHAEEAVKALDDFGLKLPEHVNKFSALLETQYVITPGDCGVKITLPTNGCTITFKKPSANLPEIKGVILKGSKPTAVVDDCGIKGVIGKGSNIPDVIDGRDIASHITSFAKAHFPPDVAKQIVDRFTPVVEEKCEIKDILPPHLRRIIDALKFGKGHIESALVMLKDIRNNEPTVEESGEVEVDNAPTVPSLVEYEAVLEEMVREKERRILIGTNVYGIQEQFLSFLKRCDEEFLNTATPSAFSREHFDTIYRINRDALGGQLGTVLTPHLEFQSCRRKFMVDGTENNVLRVARSTRDSYRPLITIRFVKGFFNIEMH